MTRRYAIAVLSAAWFASSHPAAAQSGASVSAPTYFPAEPRADLVLDAAIARARDSAGFAVVVFGADWCHDSRFLASLLKSPEFADAHGQRFAVAFIDVGSPQSGEGRNLDLVAKLGISPMRNTPALFVLAADGTPLNSREDAISWRNAESRGKDRILGWFRQFLGARDRSGR